MTSGTKIILAVITLFVGILVVYYGFVMPGAAEQEPASDETASVEDQASPAGDVSRDTTGAKRGVTPIDDASSSSRSERTKDGRASRDRGVPVPPAARNGETQSILPRDTASLPALGAMTDSTIESSPEGTAPAALKPAGAPELSTPPAPTGAFGAPKETAAKTPDDASARQPASPARAEEPRPRERRVAYTMYTVDEGDTLTSIAEKWFGDHRKWDLIAKANPVDPNRLRIGQRLRLPPKDATPTPVSRPTGSKRVTYVVRAGDTLSSIADAHYGDSTLWAHLYAVNRAAIGDDADTLSVGMKLVIPAAPKKRE